MNGDKKIYCRTVRKNPHQRGLWDILEQRAGILTGKVTFTGTLKEIRAILKAA